MARAACLLVGDRMAERKKLKPGGKKMSEFFCMTEKTTTFALPN